MNAEENQIQTKDSLGIERKNCKYKLTNLALQYFTRACYMIIT
jgi:hypothetical protein